MRILVRIIKVLRNYKKNIMSGNTKFNFQNIRRNILSEGADKVEYVELIDLKTLKKPKKNKFNIFFAFYIGRVRFIDNF